MKPSIVFITILFAFFPSIALSEIMQKMIICIDGRDLCWDINYYDDQLLSIYDDDGENELLLWEYDYNATKNGLAYILQKGYYQPCDEFNYTDGEPTFIRESILNSDHLIINDKNGNTFMWGTGDNFEYKYSDGRMVKMMINKGTVVELSWEGGNITHVVFFEGGEEVGHITCSYSNILARGIFQALNSPLFLLLWYYNILPLGPLTHGYYGLLNQNLLSEMTISFSRKFVESHSHIETLSASYYPITGRTSRKYRYMTDADGNISNITVNEEEKEIAYYLSGCNYTRTLHVFTHFDNQYGYFDLLGRKQNIPLGKGVYIKNGKKVIVK